MILTTKYNIGDRVSIRGEPSTHEVDRILYDGIDTRYYLKGMPFPYTANELGDSVEPSQWLTVTETAEILNVTKQTIYNQIKNGKMKAVKIGNAIRINRKELAQ